MIKRFFKESISIKTISSANKYGEYSYTGSTLKARIELFSKYITLEDGEMKKLKGRFYSDVGIPVGSTVVYNSIEYKIYEVLINKDVEGNIIFYKYSII